jgi:hypothetical protein
VQILHFSDKIADGVRFFWKLKIKIGMAERERESSYS